MWALCVSGSTDVLSVVAAAIEITRKSNSRSAGDDRRVFSSGNGTAANGSHRRCPPRSAVRACIVIVGLGGIAVEILHDVAVASAPVSRAHVHVMIENLKTAPLFTGARGKRPLDVDAIAAAVERISWLAHDLGPG